MALLGHTVAELCLIFRIVPPGPVSDRFLVYLNRFDISPQVNSRLSGSNISRGAYPDSASSLYLMKRAKRADGGIVGDVLPLDQIRTLAPLIPHFGAAADRRLTSMNSFTYCTEFWLNKYHDKEFFYALHR